MRADGTDKDVIGEDGVAAAYFGQITTAINGIIFKAELSCIESLAGAQTDIDLWANTASLAQGVDVDTGTRSHLIAAGGAVVIGGGDSKRFPFVDGAGFPSGLANYYLYLAEGASGGSDADYSAGKLVIKFFGAKTF